MKKITAPFLTTEQGQKQRTPRFPNHIALTLMKSQILR